MLWCAMPGDRRLRACLAVLALAGLGGCTTTIVAPEDPADPVEVFLIDQGRTASLVIPASGGGLRRYAYGEWRWYALRETGFVRAIATLLWPTRGALGRAGLEGAATVENVTAQLPSVQRVHPVVVSRQKVLAFEREIEALYAARLDTEVATPATGLSFVHHPRAYTWFYNSNHMVAAWLEGLGCRIRGLAFTSSWRVRAAPAPTDSGSARPRTRSSSLPSRPP